MADELDATSPLDDMLAAHSNAGDLHAEIVGLSQAGEDQVIDAMHDHAGDGTLSSFDVDKAVTDAQNADWFRQRAQDEKVEMVRAEERGDLEAAKEMAGREQYDLQVAADSGAHVDHAVVEAGHDQQTLDQAEWEHDMAADQAHDAAWSASNADAGGTEEHAGTAAHYEEAAVDHVADASHGGSVEMHDSVTTEEASG